MAGLVITTGGFGVTTTVTESISVSVPVDSWQVIVNVFVFTSFICITWEPETAFVPDQSPEAWQETEFSDDQDKVMLFHKNSNWTIGTVSFNIN